MLHAFAYAFSKKASHNEFPLPGFANAKFDFGNLRYDDDDDVEEDDVYAGHSSVGCGIDFHGRGAGFPLAHEGCVVAFIVPVVGRGQGTGDGRI